MRCPFLTFIVGPIALWLWLWRHRKHDGVLRYRGDGRP